ncbi:MAG: hypothetical protein ABIK23_08215 [candidate division WOR-3 bacterium]
MKTLGQFYREKVLSYPYRETRYLPVVPDGVAVKIEQHLFGWLVIADRKKLPCRSEAEARFLKLCLELGMSEAEVPEDDRYLSEILPEFEQLKARVDEIMNEYLATVLSRRVRAEVRQSVYSRLLWDEEEEEGKDSKKRRRRRSK